MTPTTAYFRAREFFEVYGKIFVWLKVWIKLFFASPVKLIIFWVCFTFKILNSNKTDIVNNTTFLKIGISLAVSLKTIVIGHESSLNEYSQIYF